MRENEALAVLAALDGAGVPWWLAGGWGVDALVGRETRGHRDLDLAVDAGFLGTAVSALAGMGFVPETDWLPVRLEVAGGPGGWVDLHPVVFDASGHGRQEGPNGTWFDYPAPDLVTGTIGGRIVPCVSAPLQWRYHHGYEPRPQDLHDLALLRGLLE